MLGGALLMVGCDKSSAGSLPPDFQGTWDVTYDDSIELSLEHGEQVIQTRLDEQGGQVAVRDAGVALDFEVDCTRPELVCPSEVWPRELQMERAPGKLDGERAQLEQALVGAGRGRCAAKAGSVITGEIMTVATSHAVHTEAVALTAGRVVLVVDSACFAPHAGLPSGVDVTLSTGFTAAKR